LENVIRGPTNKCASRSNKLVLVQNSTGIHHRLDANLWSLSINGPHSALISGKKNCELDSPIVTGFRVFVGDSFLTSIVFIPAN
jgi:hypothetical protein